MEVLLFVGLAVIAITALVKASHLRRDLDDLKRRFTDFAELSDEDRYRRSIAKPEIAEPSSERTAPADLPAFTPAPLPARAEHVPPAPVPEPTAFDSDYLGNLGKTTAPELPATPPPPAVPETPVAPPSPPERALSPVLARIRAAAEAPSPETQSAPVASAEISGGVPPAPPPPELPPAAPEIDRPIALEERLGSRVFVWLGGIALALAGGFLVKYSIEQGWLGPATRCLLGAVFAVALLGAGEWMRSRSNRIAQSLSAAGVATLYAVLFVAVAPYELVSKSVGFSLLAVLTAGAIALALRQGPFVGLLGLAGGFLTPAIVSTGEPNAPVLFVYLLALQLGSQLLARRRGWWWTSALSVAGGLCWTLLWLGDVPRDWSQDAWLGGFLLATAAATLWSRRGPDGNRQLTHWDGGRFTALGAQVGVLLVSIILLHASGFGALGWMFFGLLAAIHLGAARLHLENEPVAALSLLAALLLLIVWPGDVQQMVYDSQTGLTALVSSNPGFQRLLITELLSLGALYTIGAFAGLWGARRPLHWALYSVLASAGFFLVGYLRLNEVAGLPSWGLMSLIVAAFHALAAGFVLQQRAKRPDYNDALGAYALGVSGFVAFAVPLELKQSWMAVGWALLLPAMAWIEARLNIRWLRGAAAVIAALVLLRLLPGPWILEFPTGSTPILNWILYGYGIPLLAFGAAAWQFRRTADGGVVQLLEGGAILIGFLLVTLEIHHYFQGSLRFAMDVNLVQATGFAAGWLVVALALTRADRRDPRLTFLWGARVVTAAALAALVFGSVFWFNPLFNRVPVGEWPILNWLSFAYAMPALLFLLLAREIDDARDPLLKAVALIAAIALGFVFVTLQVRHLFQGGLLILGSVELPELSILVIAWLALSLGLVIAHRRLRRPQYLSGAVVIAGIAAAAVGFGSLLALNPLFSRQPVGSWPILNWLIPAYGVPSLLLLAIAQYIRQTPRPWLETPLQLVGGLLGLVFISLETRHLFHGDALRLPGVSFDELSCLIIVWLLLGWGVLRLQRRQPGAALDIGAYALMGVAALALALGPLFLMNPLFVSQSVGSWPILNSLIPAYAIPALLLLAMARDVRQQPQAWLEMPLQLFAGLLAFVFLSLETRHLFHGDALRLPPLPFGEWASLVILWLAAAWGLLQLRRSYPVAAPQIGARSMIVVAGAAAVLGSLLIFNPVLATQHVGAWPLLNWLIAAYALPAALLAVLAIEAGRPENRWPGVPWLSTALGVLALVMGFAFISLETRQWFQGPYLNRSMIGDAENYAYSAVWLLYGVALLAAGILRGGRALRYASMVTIMLTITKVFVLDTWGLSDLYRVASFLGLGICLIGIGYAYHRYVFRQPEPVAAKAA